MIEQVARGKGCVNDLSSSFLSSLEHVIEL